MRAGFERIGVAQAPSDVRAGTHGARDNAHHASIGVNRSLARQQPWPAKVLLRGNVVVVAVHCVAGELRLVL